MIIDFSVTNYRSIRDTITLSFIAQKGTSDDAICPGYALAGRNFEILPVAALYGANASGKTNILRALDSLLQLMNTALQDEKGISRTVTPFKLDGDKATAATQFNIRIALQNNIFTFRLSLLSGAILSEELEYSPVPEKRQSFRFLYSRKWNAENQKYKTKIGEHFSGPHTQLITSVQRHETYLSLLQRLEVETIRPLSSWLKARWPGMFCGLETIDRKFASQLAYIFSDNHKTATQLIQKFDTGLSDIIIEQEPQRDKDNPEFRLWAEHKINADKVRWEFGEESLGTQKLFDLLQPMLPTIEWGRPLIVDELGSNFHPKISREIIRMFQNPETNPNGAQLIFTSHDNSLWRGRLLRRDEIWLTEKQENGSTRLFPLSDYKVRNDLALDKAYLDGRFGAVPLIGEVEEVLKSAAEVNANGTPLSQSKTNSDSQT